MDWTATLTLAFAGIGALTGLLTVANEWAKRRAERRSREEAAADLWALNASPTQDSTRWVLTLRYDAPQDAPVMLRDIKIVQPKDADLALIKRVRRSTTVQDPMPTDDGWSRSIVVSRDFNPGIMMGPGQTAFAPYASDKFLAQLSPGARERSGRTRFRISLTIEERSAARRQRKVIVTSQEIAWTAKKPDITT